MKVWAIGDLHLSFGVPNKTMDKFGPEWIGHADKLSSHWHSQVSSEDLVLIPGDISWAKTLEEVQPDLLWLDRLPGTKVLIKGNHDYWWSSPSKVKTILPSSIHIIQNEAFNFQNLSIGGTRLWDSSEYTFDSVIDWKGAKPPPSDEKEEAKIFHKELQRLELSLKALSQTASKRLVMCHYPPIGLDLQPSLASGLLEKYKVGSCVFGHLHSLKKGISLFDAEARGIHYYLTSADYLDFSLKLIA